MSTLPPMDGRVCVVTGGNSGIGEATVIGLAKLGATVALVSRSREKGDAAQQRVREATGRTVELVVGDLGTLASTRVLAAELLGRFEHLHVLVNNAGVYLSARHETADGLEQTFAVNHLAPYLLTRLLLDRMKASGPARVVNLSSALYRLGRLDFDDLQTRKRYTALRAYGRSKLCNLFFTQALARRVADTGIVTNAVHPGVVSTGLVRDARGIQKIAVAVSKAFMSSPAKGARTSLHVACATEAGEISGRYWERCAPRRLLRVARDDDAAERLWAVSAQMCGLAADPQPV